MKCLTNIIVDKKISETKYNVSVSFYSGLYDFELSIYTDGSKSLDELLSDIPAIQKALDEYKFYVDCGLFDCDERYSELTDAEALINSIEAYKFDASNARWSEEIDDVDYHEETITDEEILETTREFILSHPEFKDKNIIICDSVNMTTDIEAIKNIYKGYTNLYVFPEGGMEPIPIDDTKNNIDSFVQAVKAMKLSPLETAIFVYDYIREKTYKHEQEGSSYALSRDTYQAINNDDIVCMGYANIYSAILNKLGIKCETITLNGINEEEAGHARNLLKIDDDKYNVHGLFISDPTFDSRDKNDRTKWLYRYAHFMKKRKDFINVDRINSLDDSVFGYLDTHSIEDTDELISIYMKNPIEMLMKNNKLDNEYNKARKLVNVLTYLYGNATFEDNNETRIKIYKEHEDEIIHDYNETLDMSTFIKALIRVRFIESKIDPKTFKYDLNEIYRNIPTYEFEEKDENRIINMSNMERLLLSTIFGEQEVPEYTEEERMEHLAKGYSQLCRQEHIKLLKEDKSGLIKVVKSIKLYNKKSKGKNQ